MEAIEIVGSLFVVVRTIADHAIRQIEDTVGDRYSRFLETGPAADPVEEGSEESSC
jgi:hypothetical protein